MLIKGTFTKCTIEPRNAPMTSSSYHSMELVKLSNFCSTCFSQNVLDKTRSNRKSLENLKTSTKSIGHQFGKIKKTH